MTDALVRKLRRRLIVAVAVGVVLVIAIAVAWRFDVDNRRAQSCESAVAERLDLRAMWDYLLATNENPDNPRAIAFAAELNHRLPLLKCERGSAVPVPENP